MSNRPRVACLDPLRLAAMQEVLTGSLILSAATRVEREKIGDPRFSIAYRYPGRSWDVPTAPVP